MATTYGITDKGFQAKPLEVIIESLNSKFTARFGSTFDVSPEGPDGQIIGIVADEINSCWQQAENGFNAYRPGAVEGIPLDNICELTHTERYVNRPTKVTIELSGTDGTNVPAGSKVGDTSGLEFLTEDDTTIPGDVTATCTTLGEIYVAPHTVNKVITPISGWTSVDNEEEGTTGVIRESDPALRARRDKTTVASGSSTVESIYSGLSSLDLEYIRIRDNDTGATINEQPSGTIFVVVDGGTKNDIARRIFDKKPGGVPTYGSESITVKDSKGYPHIIKFSRTSALDVYIKGTFRRLPGANLSSNDVVDNLKQATVEYINSLSPGSPVVWSYMFGPLTSSTPGIQIDSLFIGVSSNPTGTSTIPVDIDKRAKTLIANVAFTETPPESRS